MEVVTRLNVGKRFGSKTILFGYPTTQTEFDEMFRLRYDVYSRRGYIEPSRFPDKQEKDEFDKDNRTRYFIAQIEGGRIIGTVRLIIKDQLPTEEYFLFKEPAKISEVPRSKRGELGRFIIIPPDKAKGEYLPRNLVMLFITDLLADYGIAHDIAGGYVFIKSSLNEKFKKLRAPFHVVTPYKQHYPENGVLLPYFTQPDDPVMPAYFLTKECKKFANRLLRASLMFKIERTGDFMLKSNLYTSFLRMIHVI